MMQKTEVDFLDGFLAMERELDLFAVRERGIPYWEALRYPIFTKLVSDTGLQDYYLNIPVRGIAQTLRNMRFVLKSLTTSNPLLMGHSDILLFAGSKRTLRDGVQRDIYTDPLLDFLDDKFTYRIIERPFGEAVHKTPPARPVRYLDFIYALSAIGNRMFPLKLSPEAVDVCARVSAKIEQLNGTKIDVVSYLRQYIGRWRVELPFFKAMLRRNNPRALLVVVSAGNETLIAAAKQLGIPSVELQHGSPAPGKLNYDFPADILKETFPDFFFSFGKFWSRHVHLPLPRENIIPLGYPHMAQIAHRYADVPRRKQIVFISQRTIGRRLAAFAIELRRRIPAEIRMVFKLHPEEMGDWRERYPSLEGNEIEVAHQRTQDLYRLFAESTWQVGVYSTALYEGIAFGCRTFIVKAPGWEAMRPLVEDGAAVAVENPSEIDLQAAGPEASALTKDYFAEIDRTKLLSCIEKVILSGNG